ncbi:hypothetical protein [Fluviispira sanaruensis]|uniref:Uncharacterized protein n=1 Tax=Fluviispira sanaruensis TaxID=2493639 RepID=A0A4P2VH93_FLUSA|nr:hypothetical protein [Fluviispira sanaruensis]BBH52051.1 hypothetical protein JCM31447_04880 [Fluviispira sanaruensis]
MKAENSINNLIYDLFGEDLAAEEMSYGDYGWIDEPTPNFISAIDKISDTEK